MPERRQVEQNGGQQPMVEGGTGQPGAVVTETGAVQGLHVPRRFTTAGVHPYDEIEWERRTASLVNREGKVSFEQADVEFPKSWSLNATNIVAEKYFRGKLGTPSREWSVKQIIDRVVDSITRWGAEQGRFATADDQEAFSAELKHILVTQKAAFNSPVWFNIGVPGRAQQASACFILHVDDSMDSIADWYRDEMFIFKGGSGSGLNVSNLRSSYEQLAIGGYSSGPVSFMRGADAAAGTIKSGGATRRAAKMVVFNVDHPDLLELRDGSPGFIWCKAVEERKARALKQAGFDMSVDSGVDAYSIQYQNANNSVRVTDEFMDAYLEDREWHLRAVTTGDVINRYQARDIMRQISEAAWECADPGMQYHTTINDWHTAPAAGPITASNPCFTGDTLVHTDKGLIRFDELVHRAADGETFGVYTHDATNPDAPAERVELTSPEAYMVTGTNEVWRIELDNGIEIKCTPNHRFWTLNRGMVEARELTEEDQVKLLNVPTPFGSADVRIPVSTAKEDYLGKGDRRQLEFELPEKWDEELAHYMGWLIGDGCISGNVITTVYAGPEKEEMLERHLRVVSRLNGGREPKPCRMGNGTWQLRLSRRPLARFFRALGFKDGRAHEKVVPWSIFQAPTPIVAAFLRGLYDADGCVVDGSATRYVGLGSVSLELSRGVQMLLSTFGIRPKRYVSESRGGGFSYTRKDGSEITYESKPCYDLRIMGRSVVEFSRDIGFDLTEKSLKLCEMVAEHRYLEGRGYTCVRSKEFAGFETTYNLTEPRNHTYLVNGVIARNCSEYVHLDNSPCNLASLNLLKFLTEDHTFNTESFEHTVSVVLLAQAILCVAADYPTDKIARNARGFRELGIGYANLGALLMALGVPYDSDEGRTWAGAVTSLMQAASYRASARFAQVLGPFPGTDELPGFAHPENREATLRVLRKHAAYSRTIAAEPAEADRHLDKRLDVYRAEVVGGGEAVASDAELTRVVARANEVWDETLTLAERHGVENSQVSVLAPTGCLVGGSLVPTERGLVRLRSLGDPQGERWQGLDVRVQTDEGVREATKFFVNGVAPVVTVATSRGYQIKGTPEHRIKVVDASGEWRWKRFADLASGDVVPLALDQLIGEPQEVVLPPLPDAYWTSDHTAVVPRRMTPDLAEFVGYFMGDGSLHAKGIRLCVAKEDFDVVEYLARLGKSLFGLEAHVSQKQGYTEVAFHSVRLVLWWEACGFAKDIPVEGHSGKGYRPHIPDAILHANAPEVYRAFLRGLFEADGTVTSGYPHWTTTTFAFADDVQALLLALGYPTTRKLDQTGWGGASVSLRLINRSYNARWTRDIGFIGVRKAGRVETGESQQGARGDKIPMNREMVDRLAPRNDRLRRVLLLETGREGAVSRRIATELYERTGDAHLGRLLGFFYDRVTSTALGEEELTYDLSVPDNVTYVANGFVSHNTIGFMMDCDTTGVEPDLALKKVKKLVGGGTMSIVNQTVPRALRRLGYEDEQIEAIVSYIDENNTVVGAPALKAEHYPVFACSFTSDNLISDMGHVKMMAAVQPFLSGAISKCVTGETLLTTADGLVRIGSLHEDEAPDSFRADVREVSSLDGTRKTDAFYYGGVRPVRTATLRSGHRITGTLNHRVLVATRGGLGWRRLDELQRGEYVATKYGSDMWSALPPLFADFEPSKPRCNQKDVLIPLEMNEELAFLIGAYVAEGHISRTNWTITITNSVPEVLAKVAEAWRTQFGVEPRIVHQVGKCPAVVVSSKRIVEFFDYLGCGHRASGKRIPDAVLRSPRAMVLAFLQGLFLDAYASAEMMHKVAICVDSPPLLDDLQAILTNLGIVHGRITKHNEQNGKDYDEVYACGAHAKRLLELVSFLEPQKAEQAQRILDADHGTSTADVVPGIQPIRLPTVLEDDLYFSPVERVEDAGEREVYDLSVPDTHAFVGNGIVNHNTVNVPEQATVEEVEQIYAEGWRLGLKALAIYRDNCKADQPLSAEKKVDALVSVELPPEPVRKRLPKKRPAYTYSFRVADLDGYVHVGLYPDTREPGEIFIKVAKQGSTLAGVMDAFSISVSMGLQYGVPLETYVEKFMNMTFEPRGITDDPDVRFAASIMDFIFRRLALDFLPRDKREALGIRSVAEREDQLNGMNTAPTMERVDSEEEATAPDAPKSTAELVEKPAVDAPLCTTCGIRMRPSGSCFACESCGSTSGCS